MASPKERKTAEGILAGKSTRQAMLDAGYKESYANTAAGRVEARLQSEDLIPSDDDVRDIKERVLELLSEDAEAITRALITSAKTGDVTAQKEALARVAGPVPKRHEISTDDVESLMDEWLQAAGTLVDEATMAKLDSAWRAVLEKRRAGRR